MTILKAVSNRYQNYRRSFCESIGSDRFSRPARDDLDLKLRKYLPPKGVFIEAGAHDGYSDSNTYYLEKIRGWRGLLVEPVPGNYRSCVSRRPNSKVFNCALVAPDYGAETVDMVFGDRMSWVNGAYEGEAEAKRYRGVKKFLEPYALKVPARTLTSILDEAQVGRIDFLSLDVEGYELSALRGLDLEKYKPGFVLVECQTAEALASVKARLEGAYRLEAQLSHHDYLFSAV